jgi:Putative peptidoglycan binding domain/HlyD family secretion protein
MAATEVSRPRRRGRVGLLVTLLALVALLAGAAWTAVRGGALGRPATATTATEVPTGTATVTRTDVVQRQQVPGTIGYDGSATVVAQTAGGIVTRLPAAGAVIGRGQTVYEVDGRPVPLWYGPRPAWRAFEPGMADGPDVRALEANLAALGFDPDRAMTVDGHFSAATRAAIRRWQRDALGLPPSRRSGAIPLGQALFRPGPVRVASASATVGVPVQPGAPILTVTSTRPVVTVALAPGFQRLVRAGDPVRVVLPDGTATPGTVQRVSRVAVLPDPAAGQDGGGGGAGGGGGGAQQATIPLTIRLASPRAAAGLDQAPVQVAITTESHRGVLAAPITALLAQPGGSYAVEVVSGGARRRVPVRTGLFDETAGLVEIAGPGLAAGATVEVPAP